MTKILLKYYLKKVYKEKKCAKLNSIFMSKLKKMFCFASIHNEPRHTGIFKADFIINFHKLKSELCFFKEFWLLPIRMFNASLKNVCYIIENLKIWHSNRFQLLSSGLYWLRFGTFLKKFCYFWRFQNGEKILILKALRFLQL